MDPADQVVAGDVADEQVQRISSLVEAAVAQVVGRQRTMVDVVWLGAGSARLVVPAAVEIPVALKLGAAGVVGQRRFDFVPTHPAVLVHVARSHPVGNALVAQPCHQPVEQGWRVALLDRSAKGAVFGANLIDEVGRPGQAADPMNQSGRMVQG